jgi:hypothetical protein
MRFDWTGLDGKDILRVQDWIGWDLFLVELSGFY